MRLFCLCSLLCSLRHTAARSRKEQQKKKAGSGRAVVVALFSPYLSSTYFDFVFKYQFFGVGCNGNEVTACYSAFDDAELCNISQNLMRLDPDALINAVFGFSGQQCPVALQGYSLGVTSTVSCGISMVGQAC
ncbi:hypothetical protein CHLRE_16g692340v5 [Chlamydomonas reinhardtii]|uniref:Uncharacterized protein n=1 Tax=Chlamydomonas reinhardtii TaxID=3055 RepID=A0A2K3CWA9_CHLRE|nr:uncharacterized protein CHLRE_16g692340v5 [Chlamydomonas reinhardtii]PNW72569.1 hypothetical protein CHLRE_16g692340v5 [Chlamydomonas reinhardtii]